MLRTTYFWVDILLFGHWGTIETIFRLRKLLDSRRHHPVASVVEQNQLCCHVILYSTCLYSSSSSSHRPRPREMSYATASSALEKGLFCRMLMTASFCSTEDTRLLPEPGGRTTVPVCSHFRIMAWIVPFDNPKFVEICPYDIPLW
ncbi:hypothetical protein GEV33_003623 [Tenebrio molitor]|uniref:Uncharacterized protein n=1 Tax=Tenebrio molitor TaxID=7067 RepID=A0A8J6HT69_TENMO|nr:hypothetical protein GEV33_003623 [Tenebrio molitor]